MRLLVEHALVVLVGGGAQVEHLHEVVVLVRFELVREIDGENRRERRARPRLVAKEVVGAAVGIGRTGTDATLAGVADRAGVVVAARRPVGLDRIGRAGVRASVAALGDVARVRRGPADGRVLRVRRTARARARAVLRRVTGAGRGPALDGARQEAVRRTIVADAVAALGDVADADGRTALGIALHVCGTRGVRARARLGHVAGVHRHTTDEAGGLEEVGRAVVADPVAALGNVAGAGRRPAHARLLPVGRASDARAGAVLGRVADAGGRAAHRGRGLEGVGGTAVVHPVAALRHVAGAGRRAADGGALGVRRTCGTHARAVLGRVADAGRGTALRRRRLEEIRGTGVVHAVAALGDVTRACPRPAHRAGRRLRVGRAGGARPGTRLVRVAGAGRGAAERARVARRVLASVACPVALIERAGVAVARARRPRRLLRVGRAARAVARAVLGQVALAGRHAADGARRGEAVGGAGRARARAGHSHVDDIC